MDYLEIYLRAIREPISELQESFDAEVQMLSSFLTPTSTILDIGCGAGRVAELLAPLTGNITAIDNNNHVLTIARKECHNLENIEILFGDALALPFDNETFDITYSTMNTIGTFPEEKQAVFLNEMARVTKPNGYIINTTWRTDPEATEDIRTYYEHYYQQMGHDILEINESRTVTTKGTFERLSEEKLRNLYGNAGMQKIEFQTLGPLFLGIVGTK